MGLLENQNALDMQLVLHILSSLSQNISCIKGLQLDQDIETEMKKEKDIKFADEADLSNACISFEKIYNKFVSIPGSSECIERIISKHKDFCWNDMHPHFEIMVIFREESEINEPIKWLEENHLLHSVYKIDSSDKSIEYLKKIVSETKNTLDIFWNSHVENDEWVKNNIEAIKTPIFVKINDVSIYSKPGTCFYEIASVGFDKDTLSDRLIPKILK